MLLGLTNWMLGFLQDRMFAKWLRLCDRLDPMVVWSLWKAQCVCQMFQGQIVLVEETFVSILSEFVSSLKVEHDSIPTHMDFGLLF